jgi:ketosteroid isomerase-like protein
MPAESVRVALRFWQAAEAADDSVADVLHHQVEVRDFDLPDAGIYHGHEGFARWLADWGEPWDEYRGDIHDLLDLGPQVASFTHLRARTGSGLEVDRHDSQLLTVEDGRVVKLEYFGEPEAVIERAHDPARAAARKHVHDKIRGLYAAALRADVEGVVAELAPDYEFYPEADAPMDLAYRGHEGARRYFEEMFEAWEILDFEVERLVDVDDSVVALFEMRNRGRGSGIELTGRWAELWQTRGEEIIASRFYTSHEQALAAAGLA